MNSDNKHLVGRALRIEERLLCKGVVVDVQGMGCYAMGMASFQSSTLEKYSIAKSVPSLWDGIDVPTGKKRERMEHIDAALQKIRRRDVRGEMELPSAVRFARELGVKWPRTIQRLIQEMQDLYGMPVRFNTRRKGYEYTENVAGSPFLKLSASELVAVYLTQQLGVFENTPFKPRLKSAFRKLLGLFGGKVVV